MQRYRDVTMFVCGLVVGLALMALFATHSGKGKVPVTSGSLIVVDTGAKNCAPVSIETPSWQLAPVPTGATQYGTNPYGSAR